MNYHDYIKQKQIVDISSGFNADNISNVLFEFQKDITSWAIRRGRAAIFADCGLGKTVMQLEWARHVHAFTGGDILILAPLAVTAQTARDGLKLLDVHVTIASKQQDIQSGINITNYDKLHHFDPESFAGIVLDESSIIKHHTSKTRNFLIKSFRQAPYKLACTATPSPNDYMELGNHAEFLGVMSYSEMLSMFFIHDGGETSKWRLKGHAQDAFWKWLCSWAVMIKKPSDIGYKDNDFELPPIKYYAHKIESEQPANGMLFVMPAKTLLERRRARKQSLVKRCEAAAAIVNGSSEPWVVWCDLNDESKLLAELIPDAVEVKGSDSNNHKEQAMLGFADGDYRVIVSKPSIAGFGMNWQHCAHMVFVGLSDSFEQYYQATRRCWRFGQKRAVHVHVVTSDLEGAVVNNIKRKEKDAALMSDNMVIHMADITQKNIKGLQQEKTEYRAEQSIKMPGFLCQQSKN